MVVLDAARIDVIGRQRFAAMIETVERRQIAQRLPRFRLQIDGGANLLEVADHLQQAPDDQEQAANRLGENLWGGGANAQETIQEVLLQSHNQTGKKQYIRRWAEKWPPAR